MKTGLIDSQVDIMNFESYLTWYLDSKKNSLGETHLPSLDDLKQDYIDYLLEVTENDFHAVADILSLPPESLTKKLRKYNLWL